MKLPQVFLLTILCVSTNISYAYCNTSNIKSISEDDSVIILNSGIKLQVDNTDTETSSDWSRGDEIVVCDDNSVTHDEEGEQVGATQIKY